MKPGEHSKLPSQSQSKWATRSSMIFDLKEFSESQYRISPKEAQLLVGMNDKQVLHRIGKHFSVSFLNSNDSSIPKECASECDERWFYYAAVIHEASGTKMSLLAFMNDGKCVFVEVR